MILGFVEWEAGEPLETSLQMLTLARDVADQTDSELAAVAFGEEGAAVADHLGEYGVETVHHVADDRLTPYAPAAWGQALADLLSDHRPEAVVAPGTDRGQEVLAHVGATCDLPMAADCTAVDAGDAYEVTRHRWGGSLVEHARLEASTKLLSTAVHEVPIEPADAPTDASGLPMELVYRAAAPLAG